MDGEPKTSPLSRLAPVLGIAAAFSLFLPGVKDIFFRGGERWAYVLILSFLLSFSTVPLMRRVALKWRILDKPSVRKIHERATPLLGGGALFIGFTVAVVLNGIYSRELMAVMAGAAILFAVGVVDDVRRMPASVKLTFQVLAAGLVMASGTVLRVLPDALGPFGEALNLFLTLVWIVGVTNAMNFFDGMDGLAVGLGTILSFFLGLTAFLTGQPLLGWIAVALMGSCLGFFPYNFALKRNASIFLGDGGSTFIGFVLACLAVYGHWSDTSPVVALVSPLLIFWILIFDMVHITVERILTGKVFSFRGWLEYVGKDHLHHRLAEVLGGTRKTVLFIYLVSVVMGISAVVLRNAGSADAVLLLVQAAMIVVFVTVLERGGRRLNGTLPKRHQKPIPCAAQRERKRPFSVIRDSQVPDSTKVPASNT